ncbi:hypothetical protein PMZ80_007754 [Knufia obscura]|uniref:Uncharacterized protein n=2 Tax=Knufia TaxID=430999 RepID=A0AAN8EFC4_9EURO|nr:hypothetical protein PMZ80_007754 [Knufia obscura]KAK5954288.1 hypothetical protein OHC33_004861 [Knufia fluminis]
MSQNQPPKGGGANPAGGGKPNNQTKPRNTSGPNTLTANRFPASSPQRQSTQPGHSKHAATSSTPPSFNEAGIEAWEARLRADIDAVKAGKDPDLLYGTPEPEPEPEPE